MKNRFVFKVITLIIILLTSSLPVSNLPVTADNADPLPMLEYDHNGNLVDDGNHSYVYDTNNRLISIEHQETGDTTIYTYGPLGNRVTSTDETNSITTHYVYQGTDIIQERDGDGTELIREYAPDLAMIDHTGRGAHPPEEPEVFYYLRDTLGSTVSLADETGNIVEQYSYETYGTPVIFDAENNFLFQSAYGNTRLWTGQQYQPDIGLYLFPKRTYMPSIGRFLQRDPLGYVDGMNQYEYVGSSPTNGIDPLGLSFLGYDSWGDWFSSIGEGAKTLFTGNNDLRLLNEHNRAIQARQHQQAIAIANKLSVGGLTNREHYFIQRIENRLGAAAASIAATDKAITDADQAIVDFYACAVLLIPGAQGVALGLELGNAGIDIYQGDYLEGGLRIGFAVGGEALAPVAGRAVRSGAQKIKNMFKAGKGDLDLAYEALDAFSPSRTGPRNLQMTSSRTSSHMLVELERKGICFTAGTPVLMADGSYLNIEDIEVGNYVMQTNVVNNTEFIVNESSWWIVELIIPKEGKNEMSVHFLRPSYWITETGARVGNEIWLELDEMGINSSAEVLSLNPFLGIVDSEDTVVTGCYKTVSNNVLEIIFEEDNETLRVTSSHPIYSIDQQGWMPAKDLYIGEQVKTYTGAATVSTLTEIPGSYEVFNLEINKDHSYYVSNISILVHNACYITASGHDVIHTTHPNEFITGIIDIRDGTIYLGHMTRRRGAHWDLLDVKAPNDSSSFFRGFGFMKGTSGPYGWNWRSGLNAGTGRVPGSELTDPRLIKDIMDAIQNDVRW